MCGNHSFSQLKALIYLPAHPGAGGRIVGQVNDRRGGLVYAISKLLLDVASSFAVKRLSYREIVELNGAVLILGLPSQKSYSLENHSHHRHLHPY